MSLLPESTAGRVLALGLAGAVGVAALGGCKPGEGGRSGGGDEGGTGRSCELVVTPAGDGYDISATHTGTFPAGTVLTGHVNYRASAGDGWTKWTPPDFTVPIDGAAHYPGTTTHDDEKMKLESAQGTLDPTPNGHAVRTGCGSVAIG